MRYEKSARDCETIQDDEIEREDERSEADKNGLPDQLTLLSLILTITRRSSKHRSTHHSTR